MDKKLLRSVREYKKQSFLTPVLVAAEVFVEVLIPILMAKIIDVGIMNGESWALCSYCLRSWRFFSERRQVSLRR